MPEPHFRAEQKIRRRLGDGRIHCDKSKRANAVHQNVLGKRRALGLEGRISWVALHPHFNSDSWVAVVPDELDAVVARDLIQRSVYVTNFHNGADRAEERAIAAQLWWQLFQYSRYVLVAA